MLAYTLEDFIRLNPNYQKWWGPASKTAYLKNTQTGRQISFGAGQGQQYGIGALQSGPQGSHIIEDPGKLISALSPPSGQFGYQPTALPKYESPYSERIGQTLANIQDRPSFNYDPSKDVGLESAQNIATNAVSRAAARKNMLYSESTKSQMGKSALELVPQFEQTAFNRYAQEGQGFYEQLRALQEMENQAYGRYRDTVGDVRYGEETAYNRQQAEQAIVYQQARDQITDEKAKREFDETVRQFGLTFAVDKAYKMGMLKKSGSTGGYTTGQRTDDLFKVWQIQGKAPAGLEHLGVQPGSPWEGSNEKEKALGDAQGFIMDLMAGTPTKLGKTKDEVISSLNRLKNSGALTTEYSDTLIGAINKAFPAEQKKKAKSYFSKPLETFEPPPVM